MFAINHFESQRRQRWEKVTRVVLLSVFVTRLNFHLCCYFLLCSERVHLYSCGSGRCPDRKCLLGALLSRAWRRAWRCLPGHSSRTQLSWRPVQHFLQHWELWTSRSKSDICGPGAHSGRWVALFIFTLLISVFYYRCRRPIICGRMHPV